MENKKELQEFAKFSNRIGSRIDYVQGGGGNTSLKIDEQTMLIKASGYYLTQIKEDDGFAVLNYSEIANFFCSAEAQAAEDIENVGASIVKNAKIKLPEFKDLRPSVEAGFHSILGRFVAHTHSVYSNIVLCSDQAEDLLRKIFADQHYIYVPYVNPGSRLTLEIAQRMAAYKDGHNGHAPDIIFLQNHGVIVYADTADACFDLHEKVNQMICRYFSIDSEQYPAVKIRETSENEFCSATPYLIDSLKKGVYTTDSLLANPLYPDQIVYLKEVLGETAVIRETGEITYRMPYKQAILLEEALTAIVYIMNQITAHGLNIQYMRESQQNFIKNWESEKYRKELASKS